MAHFHSFISSRSVRVLHAALRRRRLEVRVLAGAPFQFLRGRGQQCTPLVKETMPGQRRPEDRISKQGRSCGRSSRVRVSGCEPEDPGANPGGHPISQRAQGKVVEPAVCKTALTRCESGVRVHFGAIVQQQDDAMALRRSGCDSPWLHHLRHNVSGHEEDSNPRRSDRRDTRGSTEMPDHFNSAKALVATHAAGIGERPVQLRLADRIAL